jgi:hypothetical protein
MQGAVQQSNSLYNRDYNPLFFKMTLLCNQLCGPELSLVS